MGGPGAWRRSPKHIGSDMTLEDVNIDGTRRRAAWPCSGVVCARANQLLRKTMQHYCAWR